MDDIIRSRVTELALQLFEERKTIDQITEIICTRFKYSNKESIKIMIKSDIEMFISLNKSIDIAGGMEWGLEKIKNITVLEMISILGTNRIRFIHPKLQQNKLKTLLEEKLEDFHEMNDSDNIIAAFAVELLNELLYEIEE